MLIFLDIDGVMVSAKSWQSPELLQDGFFAFNNKAVVALRKLINGNATVMLTTSHKAKYSISEWKNIFKARGIEINKLDTLKTNSAELSRKDEILNWFNANKTKENFVIIDDDKSLNDLPKDLKQHLILTRSFVGLTEDDIQNKIAFA
ncbi:MAG: hypothetical protein KF900_05000 [Bacteroidetes bacterium]|nr:hypothetical protein [Bacteroidota bacterium]